MRLVTMKAAVLSLGLVFGAGMTHSASAAEGHGAELLKGDWSFTGLFGTYDRASLQRGFQVYREVCSACHAMSLLAYRNLAELGYNEDEIKAIAADKKVPDINDEGETVERPARPSDHFVKPFPNEKAARAGNNGAYPPDLSLITKARPGGVDYLNSLLQGYEKPPEGVTIPEGMHYNKYFPGGQISMPQPLNDGAVTYSDNTPNSVKQMAHDVASFMAWSSEPELEKRKRLGIQVVLFLVILSGLLYAVKRKVWADVH